MKMVNQALSVALTATVVTALTAGCGGDSSGSPADTGLPPEKLLSDVTPAEASSACQKVQSSFQRRYNENTVIEAMCTMGAAANSSTASACSNFRDACIEEAMQPDSEAMMALELDSIDFGCDMPGFGQCSGDATVGELETCLDDTLDAFDALLSRFDCSDAGTLTEEDLELEGIEPAQSCEAIACGAAGPFGG